MLKNCYFYEGDVLGWAVKFVWVFLVSWKTWTNFLANPILFDISPICLTIASFLVDSCCRTKAPWDMLLEMLESSPGPSFHSSEHENVICSKSHNKSVSGRVEPKTQVTWVLSWLDFLCHNIIFLSGLKIKWSNPNKAHTLRKTMIMTIAMR